MKTIVRHLAQANETIYSKNGLYGLNKVMKRLSDLWIVVGLTALLLAAVAVPVQAQQTHKVSASGVPGDPRLEASGVPADPRLQASGVPGSPSTTGDHRLKASGVPGNPRSQASGVPGDPRLEASGVPGDPRLQASGVPGSPSAK